MVAGCSIWEGPTEEEGEEPAAAIDINDSEDDNEEEGEED